MPSLSTGRGQGEQAEDTRSRVGEVALRRAD